MTHYFGNTNADCPSISPAMDKKANKPYMERQRRARMNNSLDELKKFVIAQKWAQNSKLEKADILEKTVEILNKMEESKRASFSNGFFYCLRKLENLLSNKRFSTETDLRNYLNHNLNSYLIEILHKYPFTTKIPECNASEEIDALQNCKQNLIKKKLKNSIFDRNILIKQSMKTQQKKSQIPIEYSQQRMPLPILTPYYSPNWFPFPPLINSNPGRIMSSRNYLPDNSVKTSEEMTLIDVESFDESENFSLQKENNLNNEDSGVSEESFADLTLKIKRDKKASLWRPY